MPPRPHPSTRPRHRLARARLRLCVWLMCVTGALPTPALAQPAGEARVKARLTANLARFAQWPTSAFQSPTDAVTFCVQHKSAAVAGAFQELAGVSLGARAVRVQLNPASLSGCHVLYLEADAERANNWPQLAAATPGLLTVGDGADFTQRGMVALVNANDAIRFDVNLGRLRRGLLDLSSQALRLARHVEE
jgi:YfiR/HmsC-like